jgi:hypothetical protein
MIFRVMIEVLTSGRERFFFRAPKVSSSAENCAISIYCFGGTNIGLPDETTNARDLDNLFNPIPWQFIDY